MSRQIGALIVLSVVVACTTSATLQWAVVGGSKSDGNVVLGIDVPARVGYTETHVQWDEAQANAEADRRCRTYGYPGAERFDKLPVQMTCHAQGISPCWSKTYRLNYQCLDKR